MSIPNDLKGFAIWHKGQWVGEAESGKAPSIKRKGKGWEGGGSAGEVEIMHGYEKMEVEFTARGLSLLIGSDDLALGAVGLRFVGAYQDETTGQVKKLEHIMRCTLTDEDLGELKKDDPGKSSYKFNVTVYERRVDDVEDRYIEMVAGTVRYGGKDIRGGITSALGL